MTTPSAACRSCGSGDLTTFLSLGDLPLCRSFLTEAELGRPEPLYPLDVALCHDCSLVQLRHTVPPDVLFRNDYPYFSSVSDTLVAHSKAHAERLCEERGLGADDLVVELASNDGYMLQHFARRGVPVLGIDPSEGPVAVAVGKGIPTVNGFFTRDMAERLAAQRTRADVVLANNVLAHVDDQNDFVAGIAVLLKDDGVAVVEVPYVADLVDGREFDTITHEHQCYFSLTALDCLFRRHGLAVVDAEHFAIHGGSLRVTLRKRSSLAVIPRTPRFLLTEESRGVLGLPYYAAFSRRVPELRWELMDFLTKKKAEGKRIAAYGAAAKGSTLLNYCGIGRGLLDFVVDRSPAKQGKYMAGAKLPVFPPEHLLAEMPDYALLLTWNFEEEILAQQAEYKQRGGKFIVPIPDVRVTP